MAIILNAYANCDDVLLAWEVQGTPGGTIPGCLGFAIEMRKPDGSIEALHNLKGFAADSPKTGQTRDTTVWPLQTWMWTDHTVLRGVAASFRVTAMMGQPGHLQRGEASAWTPTVTLGAQAETGISAFFNRGVILSQFVSRYAKDHGITTMAQLKSTLKSEVTSPLMQFLCGELGKAIRGILQQAAADPRIELYCALFELDLPDLVQGIAALGARAHVILANGSVPPHGGDENADARAQLRAAGVDLHDRMVAPGALGHNKSVVVTMDGKPWGVWTGSTNWTMTGLHTQMNNGIAIQDAGLAAEYLKQWQLLKAAGSTFPASLKQANSKVRGPFPLAGGGAARAWFSPNSTGSNHGTNGPDIQDLMAIVKAARQGILFVMFMPGPEPLNSILSRLQDGLYVRGVVSTLPTGTRDRPSATYALMNSAGYKPYAMDVVQPQGAGAVGDFVEEFTRQQFLSGMGFAITHTKVIVVDPFGDKPVVVTGSNNFSASASGKNDENLLIIEDCPLLAQAYAVNCMSVYQHYRWPAAQHEAKSGSATPPAVPRAAAGGAAAPVDPPGFLRTSDAWQAATLTQDTGADLKFWAGRGR